MTARRSSGRRVGLAAGAVLAAVYLAIALTGDLRAHPERVVALATVASLAFATGSVALTRPGAPGRLGIVLSGALLFRVILAPTVPSLSDDVWRYLWDGHVAAAGVDPFRYAPDAPELMALRNEVWTRVNHRHVATIYPPAAQLAFRAADALGGLTAWKCGVLGFDALALLGILRMLRRSGRDPALAVLYAWNPLVLVELAGNAHVDAAAIAATAWALAMLRERRERWAVALLTVAIAVKVYPVVLVPLFVARVRDRRSWAVATLVAVGVALPYADAGWSLIASGGLRTYATHWEFNAPLFEALRVATGSTDVARGALGIALVSFLLVTAVRARDAADPAPAALASVGALLLLSPTLHPWYLTWVLPIAAVASRGPRGAWLVLSQTVLLSYAVLIPLAAAGEWRLPSWVPWVEWLPFYAILAFELHGARRRPDADRQLADATGRATSG